MKTIQVTRKLFRDFWTFSREHLWLLAVNAVLAWILVGVRAFTTGFGIDTDIALAEPQTVYNWLDIGRWGLVATQKLFHMMWFNQYVEGVMACLAVVLFLQAFCFFIARMNPDVSAGLPLFSALFLTHPIFVFQWYFELQAFDIAFSIFLVALSLLFLFEAIRCRCLGAGLPAIACAVWAFGSYQSNVVLFVCGAIIGFLLSKQRTIKEAVLLSAKLMGVFFAAFAINTLVTKLFFWKDNYLDTWWGKVDASVCLQNIMTHVREVLFGSTVMNVGYMAILILALLLLIVHLRKLTAIRLYRLLAFIVLLTTPFWLTVYTGNLPWYRSQYPLAFMVAACFVMLWNRYRKMGRAGQMIKTGIAVLGAVLVICQLQVTFRLWYTEDIRYEQDRMMLAEVITEIHDENLDPETTPVFFVGSRLPGYNPSAYGRMEMIGVSMFSIWTETEHKYYYLSCGISRLALANGYMFQPPVPEDEERAMELAASMPSYPDQGYIQLKDGLIIVRLSEEF